MIWDSNHWLIYMSLYLDINNNKGSTWRSGSVVECCCSCRTHFAFWNPHQAAHSFLQLQLWGIVRWLFQTPRVCTHEHMHSKAWRHTSYTCIKRCARPMISVTIYIIGVCKCAHKCLISFHSVLGEKGQFSVRYSLKIACIRVALYITAFSDSSHPPDSFTQPHSGLYKKYFHLVILEFLIHLLKNFVILKHWFPVAHLCILIKS